MKRKYNKCENSTLFSIIAKLREFRTMLAELKNYLTQILIGILLAGSVQTTKETTTFHDVSNNHHFG
jgi:hypothetical protein